MLLNPIIASENIKAGYIDYLTTSFHFADKELNDQFKNALIRKGEVAKGPYLEASGSFESGATVEELAAAGRISSLFLNLENCEEKDRELKIKRPLYTHQVQAFEKIKSGNNVIVTTGTGSGKTECFLIPLINHLLTRIEKGRLDDSIQAIIIYPMNALANDQMKRMRKLLKDCPDIRFGLYNGNTKHSRRDALADYRSTHTQDEERFQEPLPNEVLSREEMQERPPHILITNYSMMEYLLLRPKDDALFRDARLKFVILDEAHIYRGATGIETSLLLRRMEARIPNNGDVQYILTSATLGGKEDDQEIVRFGKNLCGVTFLPENIVRSVEKKIEQRDTRDFPGQMWKELDNPDNDPLEVLKRYDADLTDSDNINEKYAALCLNSRLYAMVRNATAKPRSVQSLLEELNYECRINEDELIAFIDICNKAEHEGTALFKAKYHFFVRALEGAYSTLGPEKRLFLTRTTETVCQGRRKNVFEVALCTDCGRIAIAGKIDSNRMTQYASRTDSDNSDFFMIRTPEDKEWLGGEDEVAEETTKDDYVVCAECGACSSDKGEHQRMPCDHSQENWIKVHKLRKTDSGRARCPACGNGHMRRVYVGTDAATSVLATELYEQLPDDEIVQTRVRTETAPAGSFFGIRPAPRATRRDKARQFLSFSDSRGEAAFFATYMEKSYNEFLRRRGIWHVADKLRQERRYEVSVKEFAEELTDYFDGKECFKKWDQKDEKGRPYARRNAWIAIMNEIYNARRTTGLISMGVFSIRYNPNIEAARGLAGAVNKPEKDVMTLLELLILDAVYSGAITSGTEQLNEAQREYIFFTAAQKKLVRAKSADNAKKTYLSGWGGRKKPNGKYYPNTKIQRICEALGFDEDKADELLGQYWDYFLSNGREEIALDIDQFSILLYPFEQKPFYRCRRCGRVTPHNLNDRCPSIRCNGALEPFDALKASEDNHYARLYRNEQMKPLYIKEHTAQLSKEQQAKYQEAFVNQRINALSCSTTFEMGVDVGSLETVYMRNVPPNPANYVQRAGRAGRKKGSAAFVLTFSKLSSHDFTYFAHPEDMISGKISAPVFALENEKIIRRHIYAVALSYFLKQYPEVYDGDDRSVFLLEGGYQKLCEMLAGKPEELKDILLRSIPEQPYESLKIRDFSWTKDFIGENGVLSTVYEAFHASIAEIEREINISKRNHDLQLAAQLERQLKSFRAGKDDGYGKHSLIDFLVRNNVLPKYGFPVDTIELFTDSRMGQVEEKELNLARDLQMAIAEYAPGSEVVADGKLYTSRYIRKMPGRQGWENGAFAKCAECGQYNFSKIPVSVDGRPCISCNAKIAKARWMKTLEPRMGFITDGKPKDVPMRRPVRDYKTDDYYVGDQQRKELSHQTFEINGKKAILYSTTNDSLVVVGESVYHVCPACGYASENELPQHEDPRGHKCKNTSGAYKVRLSHDFRTDVVKIHLIDGKAKDWALMLSVMYALLEGLSRTMGIERNDIKGCLHLEMTEMGLIYTIILYDSVAGGAGHVRRMVTPDGKAFMDVINTAIDLLSECKCGTSCYNCLRNYYNQKQHDYLDRQAALAFLQSWQGEPVRIENDEPETNGDTADIPEEEEGFSVIRTGNIIRDYANWHDLSDGLFLEYDLAPWDQARIPYQGDIGATLRINGKEYEPVIWWPEQRIAVFAGDADSCVDACAEAGVRAINIDTPAEAVLNMLRGGNE